MAKCSVRHSDEPNAHFAGLKESWMTDASDKSTCTVRIIVKLRPDEYDQLFRHVHEIGSTMSAFIRESVAKSMKERLPDTDAAPIVRGS